MTLAIFGWLIVTWIVGYILRKEESMESLINKLRIKKKFHILIYTIILLAIMAIILTLLEEYGVEKKIVRLTMIILGCSIGSISFKINQFMSRKDEEAHGASQN